MWLCACLFICKWEIKIVPLFVKCFESCLNATREGAELIPVAVNSNSIIRFCRGGASPKWATFVYVIYCVYHHGIWALEVLSKFHWIHWVSFPLLSISFGFDPKVTKNLRNMSKECKWVWVEIEFGDWNMQNSSYLKTKFATECSLLIGLYKYIPVSIYVEKQAVRWDSIALFLMGNIVHS